MLDIAIVEGVRTPFAKAFGALASVSAQELGRLATEGVLQRAGVPADQVDQVIFGNVAMPVDAANVARVIALTAGIPRDRIAHTVQRNCASGMESITSAAQLIQLGEAERIIAGGTESMSQIPLLYNREATERYQRLGRAKTAWQRLRTLLGFRPRHFKPVVGVELGLTDPVSGLIMGRTAELVARDFHLSREEQDRYALRSHQRAVEARKRGVLGEEIIPVPTSQGQEVREDIGMRADQTLESLGRLKPIFEKDGTVTVGNSCMLTDGAAAVLVMPGELARGEGREPLGYLRAFAYAGCDPSRMGLGPVFATSKVLAKTGLTLQDMELIELNEAFAAVVLGNERAFASEAFAREQLKRGANGGTSCSSSLDLRTCPQEDGQSSKNTTFPPFGREAALGVLDREVLNVNGGAIALGHPVGATGTRLVITLLKELRRRGLRRGLATLCVGGGQGAALVVETS